MEFAMKLNFGLGFLAASLGSFSLVSLADSSSCKSLPNLEQVQKALVEVAAEDNAGIFKPSLLWATIVEKSGTICVVSKTGDAWLASRIISAQKAYTAVSLSNGQLAISTAQLFSLTQPGGSLFGLQHSNPVNPEVAYEGDISKYGTKKDPLVGKRMGGINVFGGGLALYDANKNVVGALGISGDTSCTDHLTAWKLRSKLKLNTLPGGLSTDKNDNMILDIDASGKSKSGFGHPSCSDGVKLAIEALK
jgi:uncharacterized protein GlcG (DUF336 family)